jgi:hypothetical protein
MKIYLLFFTSLFFITFSGCSNDKDIKQQDDQSSTEKLSSENVKSDLWLDFPVYKNAVLEETKECPGKWSDCGKCEHKIYVSNDSPMKICAYYRDEMKNLNWMKIAYQYFPEGSCLGTWMKGSTRVFFNTAIRRSDNKTVISITIGRDCP